MDTADSEATPALRVIVTGGAGFLGTLLARRLLAGPVEIGGAAPAGVGELVVADLTAPAPDLAGDPRVKAVTGDLHSVLPDLGDADVIFHLAAVVSGAAEADFDLGMRTNVDGMRAVLEHARQQAQRRGPPVLVYTSSIAVFGIDPAAGPRPPQARPEPGLAGVISDDTLPRPQSSYGIH